MVELLPGTIVKDGENEYTVLRSSGRGANTACYITRCRMGETQTNCILKEYSPSGFKCLREKDGKIVCEDLNAFAEGKDRFIKAARKQNEIRNSLSLTNQTPGVSRIFEANGTVYTAVVFFNGMTLKELEGKTLLQYMEIFRTIAKTVGYYHNNGMLCLDIKPENIFILQNTEDDLVTQLVEFIDFDSIRDKNNLFKEGVSYTWDWAAPEQRNWHTSGQVCESTDIYAIGEIVFYYLFGRHSETSEHRGFSEFDFNGIRSEYKNVSRRQEVCALFTKLFRNTLRSAPTNRYKTTDELVSILDRIIEELRKKDYITENVPIVPEVFVGRDKEIREIGSRLKDNHILFVYGVGGIGKSTLIKNFALKYKSEYDITVYLEYESDIVRTFTDDSQLNISTCRRDAGEAPEDYFIRKLDIFRNICHEKKVLFIIDNYSGLINKQLSELLKMEFDIIIVSRQKHSKNSFSSFEVCAIEDKEALDRLININLDRKQSKDERDYFSEIIKAVGGHTLTLELIARQIAAGRIAVKQAYDIIKEKGFFDFSDEKISNYKDDEEIYDRLSGILTKLFDVGRMPDGYKTVLKTLALMNVHGIERETLDKIVKVYDGTMIEKLSCEGWLYSDRRVHLHPVIAETVNSWDWPESISDKLVMEYHKRVIDIYSGMGDADRINKITRQAEKYVASHSSPFVSGMYYDMMGDYYDVMLGGADIPETDSEIALDKKLFENINLSIAAMEQSDEPESKHYLIKFKLNLASVLIRRYQSEYDRDGKQHREIKRLLADIKRMLRKAGSDENNCYYQMVSTWYYTNVKPDLKQMMKCSDVAEVIAEKIFPTELEIIDVIHIPTANCLYYHGKTEVAEERLKEAVRLCRKHPGELPYIDKKLELYRCLLDVCDRPGREKGMQKPYKTFG